MSDMHCEACGHPMTAASAARGVCTVGPCRCAAEFKMCRPAAPPVGQEAPGARKPAAADDCARQLAAAYDAGRDAATLEPSEVEELHEAIRRAEENAEYRRQAVVRLRGQVQARENERDAALNRAEVAERKLRDHRCVVVVPAGEVPGTCECCGLPEMACVCDPEGA